MKTLLNSVFFLVLFSCICSTLCTCPNGCYSRGLCVNGVCKCNEGLSGADCSVVLPFTTSMTSCPNCFIFTIGTPEYYSGPSWELPDGPIVALNYYGSLSIYQANSDTQMVAQGGIFDFLLTSEVVLSPGNNSQSFDSCGAWMMRSFTDPQSGVINGIYHAETACDYSSDGQTHKSIGIAQSYDGGNTFVKNNYPGNKIIDSNIGPIADIATGQGDPGIAIWNGYYYLYFQDVYDNTIGVARSSLSSSGSPGTWMKLYNNTWSQPGVGGLHDDLNGIASPQVYVHTTSNTLITIGGNYVWNSAGGAILSVSLDGITWNYLGDPILVADNDAFSGNNGAELLAYFSAAGLGGGFDLGNSFYFYYLWAEPWLGFSARYQIRRLVTINIVNETTSAQVGTSIPQSKLALTTYQSKQTGERWDTIEYCRPPYTPSRILGYLMTRPYPSTKQVYDCWQYVENDHFVSFYEECFDNGYTNMRPLGFIWVTRQPNSTAVYRCTRSTPITDTFLTDDINCEGVAPPQAAPFGFLINGPPISSDVLSKDSIIGQAAGNWLYIGEWGTPLPSSWNTIGYSDSSWLNGFAPFADSYNLGPDTFFGASNYYFRTHFQVPQNKTVSSITISTASDDSSQVWLNGVLVDDEGEIHHEAAYWNRRITVSPSLLRLNGLDNVLAVYVRNGDNWAMFDAQMDVIYTTPLSYPQGGTCTVSCGLHGNCGWSNVCVCDAGFSGSQCNVPICTSIANTNITQTVIPRGSSGWYYTNSVDPNDVMWYNPTENFWGWNQGVAPFALGYSLTIWPYLAVNTTLSNSYWIYRKVFTISIPSGMGIVSATLSTASDDFHISYINGALVDGRITPYDAHGAIYWNSVVSVDPSLLVNGNNFIAVYVPNWPASTMLFFDTELDIVLQGFNCPSNYHNREVKESNESPNATKDQELTPHTLYKITITG